MKSFFKVLGIGRDDKKEQPHQEGRKSKGICEKCSTIVNTTFEYRDMPINGVVVPNVLVSTCDDCGNVVGISNCSQERIKLALDEIKDKPLNSVRGLDNIFENTPEETSENIEIGLGISNEKIDENLSTSGGKAHLVVIDTDLEARKSLEAAFGSDILESVGKGSVEIVGVEEFEKSNISEILASDNQEFKNLVRQKKSKTSKVWVNWLKFENGATIPCNTTITLNGEWNAGETSQTVVDELENKIAELSQTNQFAVLMVQKLKK